MKKILNLLLAIVSVIPLSLGSYAIAHDEGNQGNQKIEDIAKDCEFLYVLRTTKIDKLNLPNFTVLTSVNLPARTKGRSISIAGECSDPKQTILVSAKSKVANTDKVLLSYDENLQLVSQLTLDEEDDDNENHDPGSGHD